MYPVKRILVGLDLSEMDQNLISYTSLLATLLKAEAVYFLHVAKSLEVSEKILQKYPDLLSPIDETFEKTMRKNIIDNFTADCEYHVEVREGSKEDTLLRWADLKKIDLAVVGRKLSLKGSGLLPGKLSRTIHCSILHIPENTTQEISKIMVPVDFSKASSRALDVAKKLKELTGAKVILQHAYEVPSGYHLSGKSYEEFAEIMESNSYEDAVVFLQRSDVKTNEVDIVLALDEEDDPAGKAYEIAEKQGVDLIIIGSKGREELASILLGSVADKMIQYDTDIPLLVVKDKDKNLNFLQALLKI